MEISDKTLEDFVSTTINNSLVRHKVDISSAAQEYLVQVLLRFSKSIELFRKYNQGPISGYGLEPITFQFTKAAQTFGRLGVEQQRKVGDHCLFLTGFFYDFVRKDGKPMVDYHKDTGSAAYMLTGRFPFTEMAENFGDLIIVIGDLHLPQLDDERKLVDVYTRWQKTGHERYYESLLTGKGIIPQKIHSGSN